MRRGEKKERERGRYERRDGEWLSLFRQGDTEMEEKRERVLEGCGGDIKASSGNPDWLKGAMQDYERIYLRFSAAAILPPPPPPSSLL